MKTLVFSVAAVLAFSGAALANTSAPKIPTGYEVKGCTDYTVDPTTNRVTQVCAEDPRTFFFVRMQNSNGSSTSDGQDSDSE